MTMQIKKVEIVVFYFRLIDDILTTAIYTINSIINNYERLISLNRIGTNPLEHHFGLLKNRCIIEYSMKQHAHSSD